MEFWNWYKRSLIKAESHNIPVAELDWLVVGLTGIDRLSLRLEKANIPRAQVFELDLLWHQRLKNRIPVQYLLGEATWLDFDLKVSPAVLIPRPETELLIELAQGLNTGSRSIWVDLGTGSGAIALGLAQALPDAAIHAVDCSEEALEVARNNAESYQFSDRIEFYQGHWFEPLEHLKAQIVGMIANPPYIPTAEIPNLASEVKNHEPYLALDGGEDGLDAIRYLINTAPEYLIGGGNWLVEVMAGQAQIVRSLLEANGRYAHIKIQRDYAGIERFVIAQVK